jgi:hypothetical protein
MRTRQSGWAIRKAEACKNNGQPEHEQYQERQWYCIACARLRHIGKGLDRSRLRRTLCVHLGLEVKDAVEEGLAT